MKHKEISFLMPDKKICVLIKYPRWMKWFIRFIKFYVIPDVTDKKIKNDFPFGKIMKTLYSPSPKFNYKIEGII